MIDVKLSADIQKQLKIPPCIDLSLPRPKLPEIRLPTGGSIKGLADITKGVPSDCSLNFSLALQLAPIMASIECLVKVLALIGPLIEVIKALPNPVKIAEAVPAFLEAAKELAPCLLVPTPLAMVPFVKDILALIIALVRCLVQQLESILKLMRGLELQIATARSTGNAELLSTLECARSNAKSAMQGTMTGIEPIGVLLELAKPFLGIAQVDPITLPNVGSPEDADALEEILTTMKDFLSVLQAIVDALP